MGYDCRWGLGGCVGENGVVGVGSVHMITRYETRDMTFRIEPPSSTLASLHPNPPTTHVYHFPPLPCTLLLPSLKTHTTHAPSTPTLTPHHSNPSTPHLNPSKHTLHSSPSPSSTPHLSAAQSPVQSHHAMHSLPAKKGWSSAERDARGVYSASTAGAAPCEG